MKRPVLLSLFLAGLTAVAPATPDSLPAKGTFFEEISALQADKIHPVRPASGNVSIPYTRIDVAIENGIAVTRFLQTYHNHGSRNEGYAFRLPLNDDTTLSHFTLWDRGVRYAAGIEERTRAEEVYKQVTGDEAPEINRDPGLVRQTRNRYEMRVFPILPGETKQVELISHERLGMENGAFKLDLPLDALTAPPDVRLGRAMSELTEVSIFVRDDLPIETATVEGVAMTPAVADDRRRLWTARLGPGEVRNVRLRYRLRLKAPSAVTAVTFSQTGTNYVSMRVLYKPGGARPVAPSPSPSRNFYIGVWRSQEKSPPLEKGDFWDIAARRMTPEALAAITLMLMNGEDAFHGSYRPPAIKDPQGRFLREREAPFSRLFRFTLTTSHLFRIGDMKNHDLRSFMDGLTSCHRSLDLIEHLGGAIRNDDCRNVYLFFDHFSDRVEARLFELMRDHSDIRFFLVTRDEALPVPMARLKNVSHFLMRTGWKVRPQSPDRSQPRLLPFQELNLAEFAGFLGVEKDLLVSFWEGLPNLAPEVSTFRSMGDVRFDDFEVFRGHSRHWMETPADEERVLWLAGRYQGSGHAGIEIRLGEVSSFFERNAAEKPRAIRAEARVPAGDSRNRFVASFHARQKAEYHCARIEMLRDAIRSPSARPSESKRSKDLHAQIEEHRAEVVRLSRTFNFITPETAFIALPPEIQRQYGLTPQQYAAQQNYDFEGMRSGGVPEPRDWLLLLLGVSLALYFTRNSWQRSLPHRIS